MKKRSVLDGTVHVPFAENLKILEARPQTQEEVHEIICRYAPLVFYIAVKVQRRGVPSHWSLEDLFQEGMIHLMRSVAKWEPSGGRSFKNYAYRGVYRGLCARVLCNKRKMENFYGDIPYEEFRDDEEMTVALNALPRMEADIIRKRIYHERTLQEIGDEYGYSRQYINLVEKIALGRLRKWFEERYAV